MYKINVKKKRKLNILEFLPKNRALYRGAVKPIYPIFKVN